MYSFLVIMQLVTECQYGFREKHSTYIYIYIYVIYVIYIYIYMLYIYIYIHIYNIYIYIYNHISAIIAEMSNNLGDS